MYTVASYKELMRSSADVGKLARASDSNEVNKTPVFRDSRLQSLAASKTSPDMTDVDYILPGNRNDDTMTSYQRH